jgi:hypothetical protein
MVLVAAWRGSWLRRSSLAMARCGLVPVAVGSWFGSLDLAWRGEMIAAYVRWHNARVQAKRNFAVNQSSASGSVTRSTLLDEALRFLRRSALASASFLVWARTTGVAAATTTPAMTTAAFIDPEDAPPGELRTGVLVELRAGLG